MTAPNAPSRNGIGPGDVVAYAVCCRGQRGTRVRAVRRDIGGDHAEPVIHQPERVAPGVASKFQDIQRARKPAPVDYFCFIDTRQPTFGHVQGELGATKPQVRGLEISAAGDGTVPSWSASLGHAGNCMR